jgi:hypothetical protein
MIKWTVDKRPYYARSYDGVVESGTNTPWSDVLRKATTLDPSTQRDYPSCEIPMVLLEDLKELKTGNVVLEAGQTLGYATSTTGHPLFMKAYNTAKGQGLDTMVVKVTAGSRKNPKTGQSYPIFEWELLSQ